MKQEHKCESCPLAENARCLGGLEEFSYFCNWAESGDEVLLSHIVNRSNIYFNVSVGNERKANPSLIRKAANFGRAVIQHAVAGFPEADGTTVAQRLEICRTCENYDSGPPARCRACGCFLDIKLTWADQRCPINRW